MKHEKNSRNTKRTSCSRENSYYEAIDKKKPYKVVFIRKQKRSKIIIYTIHLKSWYQLIYNYSNGHITIKQNTTKGQ